MTVYKRQTTKGETEEYHYRFQKNGRDYYGVCEGCTDLDSARAYEAGLKKKVGLLATQKSVKALVENFRDELAGGTKILLDDAFDLAAEKPRRKMPSRHQEMSKRAMFGDFVAFLAKNYPDARTLNDVTREQAEKYVSYLIENGRYDNGVTFTTPHGKSVYYIRKVNRLSPTTIRNYYKACHEVFGRLADDAGLQRNPFDGVETPETSYEEREPFTLEEFTKILEKADDFVRAIFVIGSLTALREGDIALLKWENVDLEREVIVRQLNKGRKNRKKAVAEIPIMAPLMDYLKSLDRSSEYVLPNHARLYLENQTGIAYRVKKFLERDCGIVTTRVTETGRRVSVKDVHSLRHTFCYLAAIAGIPLVVVQSILVHMTPEMTAYYSRHANLEEKKRWMALMPLLSAFNKGGGKSASGKLDRLKKRIVDKVLACGEGQARTLEKIASILNLDV